MLQVECAKNVMIGSKNNGVQVSYDPGKTSPQKIVTALRQGKPGHTAGIVRHKTGQVTRDPESVSHEIPAYSGRSVCLAGRSSNCLTTFVSQEKHAAPYNVLTTVTEIAGIQPDLVGAVATLSRIRTWETKDGVHDTHGCNLLFFRASVAWLQRRWRRERRRKGSVPTNRIAQPDQRDRGRRWIYTHCEWQQFCIFLDC